MQVLDSKSPLSPGNVSEFQEKEEFGNIKVWLELSAEVFKVLTKLSPGIVSSA